MPTVEYFIKEKNVTIKYEYDLVDMIWEDRPALFEESAFVLDLNMLVNVLNQK